MSQKHMEGPSSPLKTKTFVRGAYLYSTDDGTGYEQKAKNRVQQYVKIGEKASMIGSLKNEYASKKQEVSKKRENTKKQKNMIIPIRDTPVDPMPEPMFDNSKCERATQQQFEYFQTYISQKQKQKKFEEEEIRKIQTFQRHQETFRKNIQKQERKGVTIMIQKDDRNGLPAPKKFYHKKGPAIKVVIKKKQYTASQSVGLAKSPKDCTQYNQSKLVKLDQKQLNSTHSQKQQQCQDKTTKVRVVQNQQ